VTVGIQCHHNCTEFLLVWGKDLSGSVICQSTVLSFNSQFIVSFFICINFFTKFY